MLDVLLQVNPAGSVPPIAESEIVTQSVRVGVLIVVGAIGARLTTDVLKDRIGHAKVR